MRQYWNLWNRMRPWLHRGWGWLKDGTPVLLAMVWVAALFALWWWGPEWQWNEAHPLKPLTVRWALTVLLFVIPLAIWTWSTRQRYRRLAADEARREQARTDRFFAQEQALIADLDGSLGLLREHVPGRNPIYALPWYLVLGRDDAGKTSFINRSGQNFALTRSDKASLRRLDQERPDHGVDWWIGDDAVLIDPAGELINQQVKDDPNETALRGKLWARFVEWLGDNRPRRPLNGALLIVDLPTLLKQSASDRKTLATLLRARLDELTRKLGTRVPLYVVLTKFDLVQGFQAFFNGLSKEERDSSLGFTCPLRNARDAHAWSGPLSEQYDAFLSRMIERVVDRVGQTKDAATCEELVAFQRQLAGVKPALFTLLSEVLDSERFAAPALVRGLYFSSVYQHGIPENAFVDSAARRFHLEPGDHRAQPPNQGLAYFTGDLFRKIVYPESGLAGDNSKVQQIKRHALMVSTAVLVITAGVVIAGWQVYYQRNMAQSHLVLERARTFAKEPVAADDDPTGRNLLPALDRIRDAVIVYEDYRDAWPVVEDLGLYQGRRVGPMVDGVYLDLLGRRFLPELGGGVITHMEATPAGSDERLAALRVVRMFEDRHNRKPAIVREWMARAWQAAYAGEGTVQNGLLRHLDYALKYTHADLPQYRGVIVATQAELRRTPLAERVYNAVKREAQWRMPVPLDLRTEIGPGFDLAYDVTMQVPAPEAAPVTSAKLTLIDAAATPANSEMAASTASMPSMMTPPPAPTSPVVIERLLTRPGFRDYFVARGRDLTDLAMIDQWVLGLREKLDYSEQDKEALSAQVRSLYTADYIGAWRRGLAAMTITPLHDLPQAVAVLDMLTGPAEPMRRMLATVRDNTVLLPSVKAGDKKAEAALEAMPHAEREQAARIQREFAALVALLDARGERSSYLDETRQAIAALQDMVKAVADSPAPGEAALKAVNARMAQEGPDPIFALQRIAAGLPAPLDAQVRTLADEVAQVLLREALHELEKRWDREVYTFYRERLADRYPLVASSRDAALADFEAFFGPQGKLSIFYDQNLKGLLEGSAQGLIAQRGLLRDDVRTQLQAAQRIRETFFNARGALNVPFTVTPLALSANARNAVLNADGQLVGYTHGPSAKTGLIWPNALGEATESKLTVIDGSGGSRVLRSGGPWGLFRLLSQGHLNGKTDTSVELSFTVGSDVMRYRIASDQPANPFTRPVFAGFALPRTLLSDAPSVAVTDVNVPASSGR
ncbi:type VI secretion system membrane subunit TssM [Lysobacter arvi]|uniref:Type VI secretion system membrane subunit TssM n=1 Tax=Lysobacter arvi TaxID=3038776 RepID=A0ABU1CE45_9GAMM|nr:type VI secretion system membrane subunit TssM [Lysobacter arvi]MDR0183454.1 type VI secretion system membrane subunit TssM [Lysobacter arvi]